MNKELERFKKLLTKKGYFATKARKDMFHVFQKYPAMTLEQLIARLPAQNQSTTYRNIKIFEDLGIISRLQLGWHSKLELSDIFQHHHHHLSCINCGRVTILKDNYLIEAEINNISQSLKFKPTDHQLEIRGLCATCQKIDN